MDEEVLGIVVPSVDAISIKVTPDDYVEIKQETEIGDWYIVLPLMYLRPLINALDSAERKYRRDQAEIGDD